MPVPTIEWRERRLWIIDQTLLPGALRHIELDTPARVFEAITALRVRGAPAIGVCAAYGVLVGLQAGPPGNVAEARARALETAVYLASSRPTAVNLFYALDCMRRAAERHAGTDSPDAFFAALEEQANALFEEDRNMCLAIGQAGAPLLREDGGVLTHCNAGGLATTGYGTALAPMFVAHEQGRRFRVYADETRPLLQGARLTAWELHRAGLDVTVICDNMAAQVMREGKIDCVIVGADRIAANGDTANKIGTYGVALAARAHEIPFYVAAPASTFDLALSSGAGIPIEHRDPAEVTHWQTLVTAPEGVKAYNPAFDVTPAAHITAFVTDRGLILPPFPENIAKALRP